MAIPPMDFGASKNLVGTDFERLLYFSVQFISSFMCPGKSNRSGEQVFWLSREVAVPNGLFIRGMQSTAVHLKITLKVELVLNLPKAFL